MKIKTQETILNIIFASSIVLGIYTLIKTYYLDRRGLPEGVCPVTNNRYLFYISIGMTAFYLVASIINDKRLKNKKDTESQEETLN